MDKKRLFKIMTHANREAIADMAEKIKRKHSIVIVKEPSKTLALIKMRESVKSSLFYMGEVIVAECIVELDRVKGMAVSMGNDFEKILNMAVIDAACNKGVFEEEATLLALEKEQLIKAQKENAMHLKTMVNFTSMDSAISMDSGISADSGVSTDSGVSANRRVSAESGVTK